MNRNRITWESENDFGDRVIFEFDSFELTTDQMFQKWVEFMNAIGYVLDPVKMEKMWMGDKHG